MAVTHSIWIDLENTPHVPFFSPIIQALERDGGRILVTVRDAYQTCEMAALYGLQYSTIGRHYGRNKILKTLGLAVRSAQLYRFARSHRPDLALSHGSRSQIVASKLARIETAMLDDYEHSQGTGPMRPTWTILPRALAGTLLARQSGENVRFYDGLKEDVYAPAFTPDASIVEQLGLKSHPVIATVRPPATEAHYHNAESQTFFVRFMERAVRDPGTKVILLPRNSRQDAQIRAHWPHWFANGKTHIPAGVVHGLNLLWHSDLVVSGGGTMNREAAALGIPVFSIFRGRIGAIDERLHAEGRLHLIRSEREVDETIVLQPRPKPRSTPRDSSKALSQIVATLQSILTQHA